MSYDLLALWAIVATVWAVIASLIAKSLSGDFWDLLENRNTVQANLDKASDERLDACDKLVRIQEILDEDGEDSEA